MCESMGAYLWGKGLQRVRFGGQRVVLRKRRDLSGTGEACGISFCILALAVYPVILEEREPTVKAAASGNGRSLLPTCRVLVIV